MKSPMDLDEEIWEVSDDTSGRVRDAAQQALQRIGWQKEIRSTRMAKLRGPGGPADIRCVEIWCAQLSDTEPEIRHCLSARDANPLAEMVNRFASTFEALRSALDSGRPLRRQHEGMRAANDALVEFKHLHTGHKVEEYWAGEDIVNRCRDCGDEFYEQYGAVTSN